MKAFLRFANVCSSSKHDVVEMLRSGPQGIVGEARARRASRVMRVLCCPLVYPAKICPQAGAVVKNGRKMLDRGVTGEDDGWLREGLSQRMWWWWLVLYLSAKPVFLSGHKMAALLWAAVFWVRCSCSGVIFFLKMDFC
jgi:hypothetical protein